MDQIPCWRWRQKTETLAFITLPFSQRQRNLDKNEEGKLRRLARGDRGPVPHEHRCYGWHSPRIKEVHASSGGDDQRLKPQEHPWPPPKLGSVPKVSHLHPLLASTLFRLLESRGGVHGWRVGRVGLCDS